MSDQRLIGESIRSSNDSAALMVATVNKKLTARSWLQAQLSSQLGSLGQASLGSLPLGSMGSMLGQPASRMGSYGAQHSLSQDSGSRRISFDSLSQFSPGTHSAASSMGSRTRGLTEQQVGHSQCRNRDELLRTITVVSVNYGKHAEALYTLYYAFQNAVQ